MKPERRKEAARGPRSENRSPKERRGAGGVGEREHAEEVRGVGDGGVGEAARADFAAVEGVAFVLTPDGGDVAVLGEIVQKPHRRQGDLRRMGKKSLHGLHWMTGNTTRAVRIKGDAGSSATSGGTVRPVRCLEIWRPQRESNPCLQDENLVS